MSWSFWRRRERRPRLPEAAPSGAQAGDAALPRPAVPPPPRDAWDEPDEDRPRTPAFSGASPQPGGSLDTGGDATDPDDEPAHDGLAWDALQAMDVPGLRTDLLDLVQAACHRDRAVADGVSQRLSSRGADEAGVAAVVAAAALGERLVEAAGSPPAEAFPGRLGAAAVLAQGDLVVGRAEALLRAVAPQRPRDLARFVVRLAAGMPEVEPSLARWAEAPSEELALVAAVLLAQTVVDGGGDLDRLAEQLDDLLPDA